MYKDLGNPKNLDFFWSGTKIIAKKLKLGQFFAIFANITIEHCDFRVAHTVFIFSGVVRIMKKSIFCFLTFSKFGHQVELGPLFTFSFLLVYTMFR